MEWNPEVDFDKHEVLIGFRVPKGIPPKQMNHEFSIELESGHAPPNRPDDDELTSWKEAQQEDHVCHGIIEGLEHNPHQYNVHYRMSNVGLLERALDNSEWRIVVPTSKRKQILEHNHDLPHAGHAGQAKTLEMISRHYWWKGMRATVADYVRTCPMCQTIKPDNQKKKGLLHPLPIPDRKFQQITTDFANPEHCANKKDYNLGYRGWIRVFRYLNNNPKTLHESTCTQEQQVVLSLDLIRESCFLALSQCKQGYINNKSDFGIRMDELCNTDCMLFVGETNMMDGFRIPTGLKFAFPRYYAN
ncbi:MAG: hypothetical protein Crog4KO_36250 [Crocinitomicaceae bacterium]